MSTIPIRVAAEKTPSKPSDGRSIKTLMVDFDGVLHPLSADIDQFCCKASSLASTIAGYDCEIVISSSWRHHYNIQDILEFLPTSLRRSVVGTTGPSYIGKWSRYQEILNYCQVNGISDWRALDDALLEFPSPCKELILCNPNTGIDTKQLIALKQWLMHDHP